MAKKELLGQVFGALLVEEKYPPINGKIFCKCSCACGNIRVVRADNLISGRTKSCGCGLKDRSSSEIPASGSRYPLPIIPWDPPNWTPEQRKLMDENEDIRTASLMTEIDKLFADDPNDIPYAPAIINGDVVLNDAGNFVRK